MEDGAPGRAGADQLGVVLGDGGGHHHLGSGGRRLVVARARLDPGLPQARRVGESARSEPVTSAPSSAGTSARPLMPAPPIPMKCSLRPAKGPASMRRTLDPAPEPRLASCTSVGVLGQTGFASADFPGYAGLYAPNHRVARCAHAAQNPPLLKSLAAPTSRAPAGAYPFRDREDAGSCGSWPRLDPVREPARHGRPAHATFDFTPGVAAVGQPVSFSASARTPTATSSRSTGTSRTTASSTPPGPTSSTPTRAGHEVGAHGRDRRGHRTAVVTTRCSGSTRRPTPPSTSRPRTRR